MDVPRQAVTEPWWRMTPEERAWLTAITGPRKAPAEGLKSFGNQTRYTRELAEFVASYAESFPGLESRQKGDDLGPAFVHRKLHTVAHALVSERLGLTQQYIAKGSVPSGPWGWGLSPEAREGIRLVMEECAESEETCRAVLAAIELATPGGKLGAALALVGAKVAWRPG